MRWLFELHQTNPTAQAIAILSLVCVAGMSLGSVQFRGVKLGTSGVLFAAILTGHFSKPIDHHTLEFAKEFGLVLFVFCLGLQLGPGFFASLRQAGMRLNGLALAIVLSGAMTTWLAGWLLGLDQAAMLGVFAGATTNTPALGAAQQTLASFADVSAERAALPALAYAVTYPLGIVGIIGSLLALKTLLKIDVADEVASFTAAEQKRADPVEQRTLVVDNPNLEGVALRDVPSLKESGVVVSHFRKANEFDVHAATGDCVLGIGDCLQVVGSGPGIDQFRRVVGHWSHESLMTNAGEVTEQRVIVTNKQVLGRTVQELALEPQFGVVVTRVARGDVELTAVPTLRLQFGDSLRIVGPVEAIERAAEFFGNSVKALNETQFVPLFAGIAAGIALGTLPIAIPGLPQPLRLGLAAGPLIIALAVGRLGRIGRLVWHMPRNASLAFREFGIALFFASVGLLAGPTFFSAVFSKEGVLWLFCGVCVTMIPLLAVGIFARTKWGMNYVVLSGLLAGSMTDPPALSFANTVCQSEAPAVAYATVYPLTMLLRIMATQVMAVLLCG